MTVANAHQIVAEMSDLKSRNLAFFEHYFPQIASQFQNRELAHSRLNVDPKTGSIDLLENQKPLYNGDAAVYNKKEAADFSNAFKPGGYNLPLRHSYVGEFHSGRFFHGSLEIFMASVGAVKGSAQPYLFHHAMPCVVFLGCGFGWHIRELMQIRDVKHGILVEHNPDRFLASLYLTDWQAIIQPYIDDQTRSFVFSVGDTTEQPETDRVKQAFGAAWNAAVSNVPFLPIQTMLYVHQADPFYTKVAHRFNEEIEPFVNVWGYYDDEVNQLNHVLHNFTQKIPVLNKVDLSNDERITLICGNGPSLNDYIDTIKQHREKLNVISAGSTTYTLLEADIYPDFVVTLESDLATYKALTLLPKEKALQVPVIGAAQIHPKTFSLFSEGLIYMKQETSYAHVFGKPNELIANGNPSATNAALAVALDLKLPNLYLVGLDYGFKYAEESHAKGAFYYKEGDEQADNFKNFKENIAKTAYFLEENDHGKIYTTPFYNTSRMHAQRKIQESKRYDIVNLSQGASIDGAAFANFEDFLEKVKSAQPNTPEAIFETLKANSRLVKPSEYEKGVRAIRNHLQDVSRQIQPKLKALEPNLDSIEKTLFLINEVISGHGTKVNRSMAMFLRGTIWHWLYNYYALVKSMNRQDQIVSITDSWKSRFGHFIQKMPQHFDEFLADRTELDPKLGLTISDEEPNISNWLKNSQKNL